METNFKNLDNAYDAMSKEAQKEFLEFANKVYSDGFTDYRTGIHEGVAIGMGLLTVASGLAVGVAWCIEKIKAKKESKKEQ